MKSEVLPHVNKLYLFKGKTEGLCTFSKINQKVRKHLKRKKEKVLAVEITSGGWAFPAEQSGELLGQQGVVSAGGTGALLLQPRPDALNRTRTAH